MSGDSNKQQEYFSNLEIDTIGEIMNISMGSAATAASTLLDNKVTITTPVVEVQSVEEFDISQLDPAIAVEIQYVEGIVGSNILILKKSDMRLILSQMMMTEIDEDFEIDEMAKSAICEMMNQMMGSSATVLSCFLGRTINISTPSVVPIDELENFKDRCFEGDDDLLSIGFTLTIKDSIESIFMCAMRIGLAKEIIDVSLNFDTPEETPVQEEAPQAPQQVAPPPPPPVQQPQAAPVQPQPQPAAVPQQQQQPQQQAAAPPPQYAQPYMPPVQYQQPPPYGYAPQPAPVAVQDYSFSDFSGGAADGMEHVPNIDLVMNVPVVMTVELGRTKRKIKDILEFGQGTIVQLDKQAGAQVDVIVNGQMIARGDVVVVDDNFSIRITEIIKNRDPLSML